MVGVIEQLKTETALINSLYFQSKYLRLFTFFNLVLFAVMFVYCLLVNSVFIASFTSALGTIVNAALVMGIMVHEDKKNG